MTSVISKSEEYLSFRSTVPLRRIAVDDEDTKYWTVYDAGPRIIKCPIIFFPPVSGTADIYFRQILGLSAKGYRIISLEYPIVWSVEDFCISFRKLLDHLQLDKIHIFGSSLGGFLAQKFAEYTYRSPRVCSLLLCNAFIDTEVFQQTGAATTYWMVPGFLLKRMILSNFSQQKHDAEIADSIDFTVERLESLSQSELASRLTLNCTSSYVEPQKLHILDVTLIDVFDDCAISQIVREETYKCYPDAKRGHLKSGGNFPYLSRSDEVNLHIQIHLLKYSHSRYDAQLRQEGDPAEGAIAGEHSHSSGDHGNSIGEYDNIEENHDNGVEDHGDSEGDHGDSEGDHEGDHGDSEGDHAGDHGDSKGDHNIEGYSGEVYNSKGGSDIEVDSTDITNN